MVMKDVNIRENWLKGIQELCTILELQTLLKLSQSFFKKAHT